MASWSVETADCRDLLASLPDKCVEAACDDPPYEINFAGAAWDRSGVAFDAAVWRELLRVCKPGAHHISFGAARTYHRLACAQEDAGWGIRDGMAWVYASGMPKSVNLSKAVDEHLGHTADRPIVGYQTLTGTAATSFGKEGRLLGEGAATGQKKVIPLTTGASAEAQQWDGWGTGQTPAWEPIVLSRRPLEGTLAENLLQYGTAGLHIDACRLENGWMPPGVTMLDGQVMVTGQFPKNVLLDEAAAELYLPKTQQPMFFCSKVSNQEREFGCEALPLLNSEELTGRKIGSVGTNNARAGAGRSSKGRANYHKTVKPVRLLRYLLRLIVPPGGVVLDLFAGSGSMGIAAAFEGFDYIGVELDPGHQHIASHRIAAAHALMASGAPLPKWA